MTLPNIATRVKAGVYRADISTDLNNDLLKEILKLQPKKELAEQVRLLEKAGSYTLDDQHIQSTRQKRSKKSSDKTPPFPFDEGKGIGSQG